MDRFVLAVLALTTTCVLGCGEDSNKVYNVRQRRDKLSENVVIGMDYFGKPKIVCHCDAVGVQKLTSRSIVASKRTHVVKVKADSLKTKDKKISQEKNHKPSNKIEEKQSQRDLIYSPTCCKIDLTNPRKLYSYPFTLRLPDQTFTDDLANPTSQPYQGLKNQLVTGLTTLLANEGCVVSIDITKFRKGSVLADVVLAVQGLISQSIIDTLKFAVESGSIGGLKVEISPELPPVPTTTPKPATTAGSEGKEASDASEAGQEASEAGQEASEAGQEAPEAGQEASEAGKEASEAGKEASEGGDASDGSKDGRASKNTKLKDSADTSSDSTGSEEKTSEEKTSEEKTSEEKTSDTGSEETPAAPPSSEEVAIVAPTNSTTPAPTTPAPVMTPENPTDSRPTVPYATSTSGKEFKVAIVLTEKSFDPNLNVPSSLQYLDLKKMMEQSWTEIFKGNPEFMSATVLGFRPAVYKSAKPTLSPSASTNASRRSTVPLMGVEVTLDFKFRTARPGLLVPLETQLKIGSVASHAISPEMAAVIIMDKQDACPSTCRQPSVCYPSCSSRCCSPPQVQSCPSPCSIRCSPSCTKSCCTLTK